MPVGHYVRPGSHQKTNSSNVAFNVNPNYQKMGAYFVRLYLTEREDYFPQDIMHLFSIWCVIKDEWKRDVSSTDLMIDAQLLMKYTMNHLI